MNQIEESFERGETPREECGCAGNLLPCWAHFRAAIRGEGRD